MSGKRGLRGGDSIQNAPTQSFLTGRYLPMSSMEKSENLDEVPRYQVSDFYSDEIYCTDRNLKKGIQARIQAVVS